MNTIAHIVSAAGLNLSFYVRFWVAYNLLTVCKAFSVGCFCKHGGPNFVKIVVASRGLKYDFSEIMHPFRLQIVSLIKEENKGSLQQNSRETLTIKIVYLNSHLFL